ncbi:hypothetical protein B0T24DRAFT_599619 [Lasiosphaeria ovina]|uniref:EKC/KEOPS complex subunit BUD32 n=1 Tax=Lasiosphaeria ovina TaxID=92902 RepID=A0AAE0MY22_9PEZI|nr:hypothetical protein B0T24DRAFT_599619 [Lasiosphaeria ovina]
MEPLASGLWGSVSRVKGKDVVVKVAKDVGAALLETEKHIFERLGDNNFTTPYFGIATVDTGQEQKPGLLFQYCPLGSSNFVHGDVAIHNMLVHEETYNLTLNDFGGSSMDGAKFQVECSPRYHRPHSWRFPIPGIDDPVETWKIPTRTSDTYALGTIMFEIFTGA